LPTRASSTNKRPPLTPEQRSLRAKAAVEASWKKTVDPAARTANARKAALARFEREIPASVRDPRLRARMAEHALKSHMASLALKSSRVRSQRKAATNDPPVSKRAGNAVVPMKRPRRTA
jgi:hypothetical protein